MIPSDRKLWVVENYEKFLGARLKLIWKRTEELLNTLSG